VSVPLLILLVGRCLDLRPSLAKRRCSGRNFLKRNILKNIVSGREDKEWEKRQTSRDLRFRATLVLLPLLERMRSFSSSWNSSFMTCDPEREIGCGEVSDEVSVGGSRKRNKGSRQMRRTEVDVAKKTMDEMSDDKSGKRVMMPLQRKRCQCWEQAEMQGHRQGHSPDARRNDGPSK
jgi:hypothetical protein